MTPPRHLLIRGGVVALSLLLPASVAARPGAAAVRLGDAVTLATAYWGGRACVPDGHVEPAVWNSDWSEADGVADPTTCSWALDPRWTKWRWWRLCAVVVHEFGHLAGLGHSEDSASVMTGYALFPQPEICGRSPRSVPESLAQWPCPEETIE